MGFSAVGLIINTRKKQPVKLGKELIAWLAEKGVDVLSPEEDAQQLGIKACTQTDLNNRVQAIIVLGGDGTFLRAARYVCNSGVPLLGVNLGFLGFLTEIETSELYTGMEKLLNQEYYLEERMMLKAEVYRNGVCQGSAYVLNDVVVNKGSLSRIVTLETFLEEQYVTTFTGDGIIISTPTGSTAYSLSAGGPIAFPEMKVTIVTPICPHSMHVRPLVVPSDKVIKVIIKSQRPDASITFDGQFGFTLTADDEIFISQADINTRLIRLKKHDFFEVMRIKLQPPRGHNYD